MTQRRALAALILAESERNGAGHGTRLPTERQLAADLGVSRAAIRHAMALLQAEGRVSREVGRGTFLRGRATGRTSGPDPAVVPAGFQTPRPGGRGRLTESGLLSRAESPATMRRPT